MKLCGYEGTATGKPCRQRLVKGGRCPTHGRGAIGVPSTDPRFGPQCRACGGTGCEWCLSEPPPRRTVRKAIKDDDGSVHGGGR